MTISLVKGRHAKDCQCRICALAKEVLDRVEASRFQEAPEQPQPISRENKHVHTR